MAENPRNKTLLKTALLSVCLVGSAMNGITGNIPEMAKSFPAVPLYIIELLTTIPALFAMFGVLTGKSIAHRAGYKKTLLLGIALCAVGGSLPFFIRSFYLIFVTRCLFGIGNGFIISTLMTLIIHFFEGSERSGMIGLQGSINGLGSALSSFIGGQLLVFGWQRSFAIYFVGFLIFPFVLTVVPEVKQIGSKSSGESMKDSSGRNVDSRLNQETSAFADAAGLAGCAALMFISVGLLAFFTIKASSLITGSGYGTCTDGSTTIAVISLGAVLTGALYGRMHKTFKGFDLFFFYAVSAAGFFICRSSQSLIVTFAAAFLAGIGYMGFIPFLQDRVAKRHYRFGETATAVILIAQSLGSFAAPYLGKMLDLFTEDLKTEFMIVGILYCLLAAVALVLRFRDSRR